MNKRRGHEERDVDVGSLFLIALSLFLGGVIVFIAAYVVLHYFQIHEPAKTAGRNNLPRPAVENFPQPRLLVQPGGDLEQLRLAEDVDLSSYGWVDRNAGIVRVPVERAMEILLQRGLPDVGAGQTPLSLMQARPNETATSPRLDQTPNP